MDNVKGSEIYLSVNLQYRIVNRIRQHIDRIIVQFWYWKRIKQADVSNSNKKKEYADQVLSDILCIDVSTQTE